MSVQADNQSLSLAHKRWSQGEAGAVVIEEVRRTASVRLDAPSECEEAFLASLALSGLHARDLYALYQGWLDRVTALQAASITGKFALPGAADSAAAQRDALAADARLLRDIASLRARAAKETQMNRRVELMYRLSG